MWDCRAPSSSLTLRAHDREVLSVDWNKWDDCLLATGGADGEGRIWDLRRPGMPLSILMGHGLAVRRVAWSPHQRSLLASASYDMSVCLWETAAGGGGFGGAGGLARLAPARRWGHHTEFAVGLSWSNLVEGAIASSGWDGRTFCWDALGGEPGQLPRQLMAS